MEKGLRWFARRVRDLELMDHLTEIVDEGFDYEDPCDYVGMKKEYIDEIAHGSTITFINSYNELDSLSDSGQFALYKFIRSKFLNSISEHYDMYVEECD
jgi:hypothetical protein